MPKVNLNLQELVDAKQLRADLTALTAETDGDGSDPKIRSKALALLKDVSKAGRIRAEEMLLDDGSGSACATRISHLQDEIIRCIYDFAVVHVVRASNLSAGERMSILAVGGYGRGTLAPGSDLDLLFLLPYKKTALVESIIEYILYMLWDMGYKVGNATRTVPQCISLSLDDMTIRTAVLEARYLWGEESLYEELLERFDEEIIQKTAPEFIAAKLDERDVRHQKSGLSRYLVEPNVKDGKGGLRDLHTLFWISKYYYRVRTQKELLAGKVFSASEFRKFTKAQDFLWSVRCHMHFETGRAEERLSFDLQPVMAERLGYVSRPGQTGAERFMKHYFLVAKDVGDLTLILCSKLEDVQAKSTTGVLGIVHSFTHRQRRIKGTDQFYRSNNRITPIDKDVFKRDPVNILRLFHLAEDHGLRFHPDALRLVTSSLKLIDKSLRKNPDANAAFLSVLTSRKTPERTLRKMNESGVLGRFIPAFGKVVAMMQFNMYHHFTVDEHLLRSIGVLSEIEHGELGEQHPLSHKIMEDSPNRVALYVALLLHDIAKGRPEDHSIAGAKIAKKICPRLGLNAKQTDLVAWLIEQHLVMSNTAQSRDLHDLKTITDFAKTMQSMERMKALLVLTVCDISAVGPGVWNGWKGQLLRTLYYETEPRLTGGISQIPQRERIAEVKQELADALTDWPDAERKRAIGLLYGNYLLTVAREDQIRQLEFIRESDAAGLSFATTIATRDFEAVTEITLLSPDHPRLLSTITGCCSVAGANIVDAQIFTMKDGRALDTIYINRLYNTEEDECRRAKSIGDMIERVLLGEVRLNKLLAEKTQPKSRMQAFSVEPLVKIDNRLSDKFTVIEVEGLDRPGLLSDITGALADMSLDIASAHIATFGEKVIDTFYAVDLVGHKIISPQKLAAVKRRLLVALEGKKMSGTKDKTQSKGKASKDKGVIA